MNAPLDVSARPLIGFGQVRHVRLQPKRHAFAYDTYFLMLPMRTMAGTMPRTVASEANEDIKNVSVQQLPIKPNDALAVNQPAALSFYDSDHGDGRGPERGGALAWLDELLQCEGILDADGEVWLHCYPRVFGFTFKPVSFWYCHSQAVPGQTQTLRAIVVEVNNTFGERHCYVLDRPRYGHEQRADKVFHVSPFCKVEGRYRFRFMRTQRGDQAHTVARVDHDDASGNPLIQTSVSGQLVPVTAQSIRHALWHYPAMTLAVVVRIHWQALHLWVKRLPFFSKPEQPDQFVSR